MTNMKPMTYTEFTDLNIHSNLTDFVLYLRDRGVIDIMPCLTKNVLEVVTELHNNWLEVAKEELKERNESIGV